MTITKCPDCGGELEEGAIMDSTYGGILIERYAKTKMPQEQKFALVTESDFQDIRRVITYRCTKCNRLFPYAQDIILGKNVWQAVKKGYLYIIILVVMVFTVAGIIATLASM